MKQLSLISLALKRTQNKEPQTPKLPVNGSMTTSADTHARPSMANQTINGRISHLPTSVQSSIPEPDEAKTVIKPTFSSEESLSKVDFWKDSVTTSAVIEKMTVESPANATQPSTMNSSKMDSFFNGRKTAKSNVGSDEVLPEQAEDAESFVEQPDYDSDSWLR